MVLKAFIQYGEDCAQMFNGIFAFAVWDSRERRLFLCRDRIGVKPLFFGEVEGGLIFASEIKTVLASGRIPPRLDAEGAAQLLLLGPGRTPGCGVFRGVRELEPGCCALWDGKKLKCRRYWQLQDKAHFPHARENVEYFQDILDKQNTTKNTYESENINE